MGTFSLFIKRREQILWSSLLLIFCFAVIAGCVSTGKPQLQKESYLIDYKVPVFEKFAKIDDIVRISRFTIAAAYNNTNMIFRQDGFSLDSFNYNRWAVNPADRVADNLLRYLQASGIFRAAFSRYVVDEGRYVLQGGVDEFFFRIDKSGNSAVLSLSITLKDTKQQESNKRIVFQKKYRQEESFPEQSPRGYCQAMSRALQKLSPQTINDVYRAVKTIENK
jgi:ABC-type uncharacterized transport system auxiliary subunit